MKYKVKFAQYHEIEIDAYSLEVAQYQANLALSRFPPNSHKLISIIPEGVVVEAGAVANVTEENKVLSRNEEFADNVRRLTGPEVA